MLNTFGFIGGGRVTRFLLEGLKRAGRMPERVVVSDVNEEVLNKLKKYFPQIESVLNDNTIPASQDIVFLAIHPPAIIKVLEEIRAYIKPDAILISLAPKLTIAKLTEGLGGFQRIVRMIPNAPSFVNRGYNPLTFSPSLSEVERKKLIEVLSVLGECPEVEEEKLEAYAILTAMGPTYFWFQLYELIEMGKSFGLSDEEIKKGLEAMIIGAVKTMVESGLPPEEVMDLVPVKPLGDKEQEIRNIYRAKLESLFRNLKAQ